MNDSRMEAKRQQRFTLLLLSIPTSYLVISTSSERFALAVYCTGGSFQTKTPVAGSSGQSGASSKPDARSQCLSSTAAGRLLKCQWLLSRRLFPHCGPTMALMQLELSGRCLMKLALLLDGDSDGEVKTRHSARRPQSLSCGHELCQSQTLNCAFPHKFQNNAAGLNGFPVMRRSLFRFIEVADSGSLFLFSNGDFDVLLFGT